MLVTQDAGDGGMTAVDAGGRMTFGFVSAVLTSPRSSTTQMNAQIAWHGTLHGSAGGITFTGTIH